MNEERSEIRNEVKRQVREQSVKWVIAGILTLFAFALSGWWLLLKPKIDGYIFDKSASIPNGAVVAFLSSESRPCPSENWKVFDDAKGRFIIGAGQGNGSGLTGRAFKQIGGVEKVFLTEQEMPPHDHAAGVVDAQGITIGSPDGIDDNIHMPYFEDGSKYVTEGKSVGIIYHSGGKDGKIGTVEGHNNMPPYLALYYCVKDA